MTHSNEIVEGFNDTTKMSYRLLRLANTPDGFLMLLPKLMRALEKDGACKKPFNAVRIRLLGEDEELQNHKQSLINWMKSGLKQLLKLESYQYSEVKKSISIAELLLSGKAYEISSVGYLDMLISCFERACRVVAFYGSTHHFDKWLKVTNREHLLAFKDPFLINPIFNKAIKPSTKEGKKICQSLGHGFSKAFVRPGADFFDEKGPPRYAIEWGDVDSIAYPEDLQIWRQSQDLHLSKIKYDHKAEHILRYLLHLCHFEKLTPTSLFSLPKTKSVFEAEAVYNQQLLQYYLSKFKTIHWDKSPSSKEEILSKLDRFLALLRAEDDTERVIERGPRSVKDDARKIVQEKLEIAWDAIEKAGKKPRNFQELKIAVLKANKSAPDAIKDAISDKLLHQEVSKFAKCKDWKPTRGKDRAIRHTI